MLFCRLCELEDTVFLSNQTQIPAETSQTQQAEKEGYWITNLGIHGFS